MNGHGSGATKLLRGLFERAVTLAYLVAYTEKTRRYMHYTAINEHKMIQAARKLFCDEEIDKVLGAGSVCTIIRQYEKYRPEFLKGKKLARSWDIPFSEQIEDVGEPFEQYYLAGYLVPTMHVHATSTSVYSRYEPRGDDMVTREASPKEVLGTLIHAHAIFFQALELQINLFKLPLVDELAACHAEIPKTWNLSLETIPDAQNAR